MAGKHRLNNHSLLDSLIGNGYFLQIPFTQKTTVVAADNDKQICVLTQSGAFKKQLQMHKFNFGFNQSDDDESLNK